MAVFKKQGVYWIDCYVNGHRKRERIRPDKKLAETVLKKRKVEIAEGKFLDKWKVPPFASHLVMAGVDLVSVKQFLGHADLKMTLRYAHLAPNYKRAAIDRLDTYMDTRALIGIRDQAVNP